MQLTTTKALDLFEAFSRLTGYARAIQLNGATQTIVEPYDIGPKAQWNIIKNRGILRPIKDQFTELKEGQKKILDQFVSGLDPNAAPGTNERMFAAKEAEVNAELKRIGDELHDVVGMLKIPAAEIHIRRTDTTLQPVLEALLSEGFLEGEPDFGDKK